MALAVEAGPAAACAHCGLGVPAGQAYCCYGCELAAEIGAEGEKTGARTKGVLTLCLLLFMAVMMLSMFLFAEDVYGAGDDPGMARLREVYRIGAALFSTPVVLLLGVPLAARAWRSARAGRPGMDLLVATGAAAAWALSLAAVVRGHGGVYFDSAAAALLLATLGRYLEASARARASRLVGPSVSLAAQPVEVRSERGYEARSPALVVAGDVVRVPPEHPVPVDVRLVGGPVEVDLAVVTGESAPRTLREGDEAPAGAVPLSGALEGVALRPARESTLERLAELARALRDQPSRTQRLADAFATALVPLVWALALGTFAYWAARGPVDRAVVNALAVVLAACPCTYGVATPLGLWLGLRKALQHGVLLRSADALERLAGVEVVAFDKTGTLTESEAVVRAVELAPGALREEALSLACALDAGSPHPVARALARAAAELGAAPAPLSGRRLHPGLGATGCDAGGRRVALGSEALLAREGVAADGPRGRAVLAVNGRRVAGFGVGEALRPEARAAVASLAALGVRAVVLTGDAAAGAQPIAAALGLHAHAGLTAAQKVERLEALGERVAMVGDGSNDAPALARAALGFAMDDGSGLARGIAHATLLAPDLRRVPWTLHLARRSVARVRANLAWSTAYNLAFLGLAASGALRPAWAGLAMLLSSLVTLVNALRIEALPGPEDA